MAHDDMLALPDDSKAYLLQSAHRILVVDAGDSRHVLRGDLNLAHHGAL